MGLVLLTTRPADIVDGLQDTGIDIAIILGRRFTTDVCRGRDEGLLETIAEFLRKGFIGDANTDTTIFGNKVLCQIDGAVENQCRGFC